MKVTADADYIGGKVGDLLQRVENVLAGRNIKTRMRFPRGFIRTVQTLEKEYPLHAKNPRRNVAYTIQGADVIRWLLNRFDLQWSGKQMTVKVGIIQLVSVIETMLHDWLTHNDRPNRPPNKLKKLIGRVRAKGKLPRRLAKELQEIRVVRDKIHLYTISGKDWGQFGLPEYNRTVKALHATRDALYRA